MLCRGTMARMTQSQALDILKTGGNVFLTGEPGAGKTYVLNQYIAWLEAAGLTVAVTASTGIAATHIGGMTIHSWSGIGARDALSPQDLDRIASNEKLVRRIRKTNVLVIDEISMLGAGVLDGVEAICRTVRQRGEAFGGVQVIFVGDFFQLPPITARGEEVRYAFESGAWQRAQPLVCYLTEQYRQDDEMFLSLLRSIRKNDINEDHYTLLQEQTDIGYADIEPTKLYTHNADVDAVNAAKLRELAGSGSRYQMSATGNKQLLLGLVKSCLSPELLELKEDAMVMCTKNNFEQGYVNGTLGRVIGFDGLERHPIIRTADGRDIKIKPTTWDVVEDKRVLASIEQVPLRLAWAITVHKSQGMSLDAAEMDLSKAFVYGQGYVALSRVRTLAGLKLLGMNPNALMVDPRVVRADERFVASAAAAEREFTQMEESDLEGMHKAFVTAMGGAWPVSLTTVDTDATQARQVAERIKKESTFEQTLQLLQTGLSVLAIAKERSLSETTIWGHIERLVEEEKLSRTEVLTLAQKDRNWTVVYERVSAAFDQYGTEKLKPIFEACNEEVEYGTIRVARLMYQLER